MKKAIIFTSIVVVAVFTTYCQINKEPQFNQAQLDEFELLNLCHCNEYLRIRHYDYVAFKTEESKLKYLESIENQIFGQYVTNRLHGQYYQAKYDSSLFIKQNLSVYFESKLDFSRLDSLYYEPLVQHYVKEQSKTEKLPYLGLDYNFLFDCFYKVKEIPLEKELELFIKANSDYMP